MSSLLASSERLILVKTLLPVLRCVLLLCVVLWLLLPVRLRLCTAVRCRGGGGCCVAAVSSAEVLPKRKPPAPPSQFLAGRGGGAGLLAADGFCGMAGACFIGLFCRVL